MFLFRYSRHIILGILVLAGLSLIPVSDLEFDFNIESFFPSGDPDRAYFTEFQDRFHTRIDDEFIMVALSSDEGIFHRDFLESVDSMARFIGNSEHIFSVYSITTMPYIRFENGNLVRDTLIHIDQPGRYAEDAERLYNSPEYNIMLSGDRKTTVITALNLPGMKDAEKDALIRGIETLAGKLDVDAWHVAAKIKLERTYTREIQENLTRYLAVSLLLITIVLLLTYRSGAMILLPMLIIAVALLWTLGLIGLSGGKLDILSSLLPPVLAVIGISDIVHVYNRYLEESRSGMDNRAALKRTLEETGMATLFTSLTTAAGFYSLCISNVPPIRSFGFFAGTGVLLAYLATIGILLGYLSNSRTAPTARSMRSGVLQRSMQRLFEIVSAGKRWIVLLFALMLVPAGMLVHRIEINSSLLMELPEGHSIRDDYAFFEEQFAGTRSFELALELRDSTASFLDLDNLRRIGEIEVFLKDSLGVGAIFSPATFIKGTYKALSGAGQEDFRLPDQQADVYTCFNRALLSPLGRDMIRYITQDGKHARIGGRLPNLTIKEFEVLENRLLEYFSDPGTAAAFTPRLTGSAQLIDKVSYSLVHNLFTGLAIGLTVISLIVISMFRSIKMVVIVLLCNAIPLVLMAAVMGAVGIYLKADTAVIFAISLGIVVDDSIHFVSRFRIERGRGIRVAEAVRNTYRSAGKAMVITTCLLLAGFISLTLSSFGGTYYIGLLVSLCLVFALIIDFTLLPALILLLLRDKDQDGISRTNNYLT